VAVDLAASGSLDIGLSSSSSGDKIGVRLGLGGGKAVASLFQKVGGTETSRLGSGSRNTTRTLSLAGTQRVEVEWRENNVFYRIYPEGSARPAAPLGGFTVDTVNLSPNSLELAATGVTTRFSD
jgi:hypothetical protein